MRIAVFASLLAAAVVMAGCGPEKAVRAPCPAGKVCLEMGIGAEVTTLDPNKIAASWEDQVVGDLMVGLVGSDMMGEKIPGVATRWESSPDGLTWTFHLRRDAKWSDGEPVTADDFVYSLQRILKPETASEFANLLYVFKNALPVNEGKMPVSALGVKALDPYTVQYMLEHPAPYLLELAQHQTMYPVPKHVAEKLGDAWLKPENYVSNGPYKIVSWKIGDRIKAVKNPYFWEASQVCVDQVNYYPTEDRISGERQVKSGSLDTNTPLSANRVAFLKKPGQMPQYVRSGPMLGTTYFALNNTVKKFQDPRVRLALSMSIDRDFLVDKVRNLGEPAAYTFVPPGIANYTPPAPPAWASWPYDKRVEEAKRLLKAAGYGPGHPLTFEFTFRGYDPSGTYAAMQADWRKIGIQANLLATESQIAYQQLRVRDYEFGDVAWVADYNDAMNFLNLLQSTTGAQNYTGYKNPRYDALLGQADVERDLEKRAAIMKQAEQMMLDDGWVIPFYSYVSTSVTNPRVTGFQSNITDKHRVRYICFKDVKR